MASMKVPIDEMTFAESEYHRGIKFGQHKHSMTLQKQKNIPYLICPYGILT